MRGSARVLARTGDCVGFQLLVLAGFERGLARTGVDEVTVGRTNPCISAHGTPLGVGQCWFGGKVAGRCEV